MLSNNGCVSHVAFICPSGSNLGTTCLLPVPLWASTFGAALHRALTRSRGR